MARRKKTEYDAAISASDKHITTQEMKQIKEQFSDEEKYNFASAMSVLHQLRDVTKTYRKSIATFDKEQLITYLKNIGSNENNLRNLSWYMFYRSQVYRRIILYNACMFELNARSIIPKYSLVQNNNDKQILRSYYDTAAMLDNMKLPVNFLKIFITCFTQDVFYGVAYYNDDGLYIMPLPPEYCKLVGQFTNGDFAYAFNMMYFSGANRDLLDYWGEPFLSMYKEYEKDTIANRWRLMPKKYTACFKQNVEDWTVIVPPFSGILNDIIALEDTKNVQAIADEQDIYKMIYLSMETLGKTIDDWKVDPEILIEYFDRMCEDAIPDYTSAAIVPGKLETISFDDNKNADINKVSNATKNVLNNSGGAQLLNSQSIQGTTGLLAAIKLDTKMAISSLLPQVEGWLNRFTGYYINDPSKVKFFEVSYFTKSDLRKELLENATYSLPTKLAVNVLSGFSELETLALNHFEEDILGLGNILTSPLQSSHTTSNVGGEDLKKDPEELTDSGEASREKRDRSNG